MWGSPPNGPIVPPSQTTSPRSNFVNSLPRGSIEQDATDAVLEAAGHLVQRDPAQRATLPAGLTPREAEVLQLAARGLTTKEIAEQLFISPKTADHHIQHTYAKIGVSTRAAAALWAMQHDLVR